MAGVFQQIRQLGEEVGDLGDELSSGLAAVREAAGQQPPANNDAAQAAKARFAANINVWKVMGNRTQWALRGVRNFDTGHTEAALQNVTGASLQVNAANAAMIRTFSGWKVSVFPARCGEHVQVQNRFDILFGAIKHVLLSDLDPSEAAGAAGRARMSKMLAAFEDSARKFRAHVLHNADLYDSDRSQCFLSTIVDADLEDFSAVLRKWVTTKI